MEGLHRVTPGQDIEKRPLKPARLVHSALTDVGKVRDMNQDTFVAQIETGLFLVADGMGGKAGGELASRLAAETISDEIKKHLKKLVLLDQAAIRSFLAAAVNKASLRIYERSLELPQFRGMGTTTTLIWIPPQFEGAEDQQSGIQSTIAHVGDSRLYLARSRMLFQITADHSLVSEQIRAGVLSPKDPMLSHIRNVITRCVGYQEEEEVDTHSLPLQVGDRILICSDGLTNKVTDEEIRQTLFDAEPATVSDQLLALANERGGEDNITVVALEVR